MNNTEFRQKLWYELKSALTYKLWLLDYVDKGRRKNRFVNSSIVTVAFAGPILYQWTSIGTLVTSIIVAILSFFKSISPLWLQSEEDLIKLEGVIAFFDAYQCDLEKLWIEYENETEDKSIIMNRFFELNKNEVSQIIIMNKYARKITRKETNKTHERCDKYLREVFGAEPETVKE